MKKKRRVMVSHHIRNSITKIMELKDKGAAVFHEFGLDNDEGSGSYSIAIVEWPNGEVESVYVELIRFLDSEVAYEQS
ncbi:MAG TPA: hypothetical protein DCW37_07280 [Cellvibrionales bacterium]|nr:hypothetical protein [Cellvibrionales bacterium]